MGGFGGARAVLYLHGMGESRCKWVVVEHLKFISCLLGLHVLAIDYRGFGDSTGYPTEVGLCTDAAAGLQWLCDHGNFRPDQVVCWGHSLGTGVAVRLAHAQQKHGAPLRALVLESAYLSLRDAGSSFPFTLGWRALPLGRYIVFTYFRGGDELNTKLRIGELELPILLLHGKEDTMVPCKHGLILHKILSGNRDGSCGSNGDAPHAFVVLPRSGHLDCIHHESTLFALMDFLCGSVTWGWNTETDFFSCSEFS